MKYLSINTIIDSYLNLTGDTGMLDRVAIKQFAEFTLRELSMPSYYDEGMSYLKVENGRVELPEHDSIVQLAYSGDDKLKIRRANVIEWIDRSYDGSGADIVISKVCPHCDNPFTDCTCKANTSVIYDADQIWREANAGMRYRTMKHYYGTYGWGIDTLDPVYSGIDKRFQLMRPATNSFFNADNYIPGCLNLNNNLLSNRNRVEYKLINGNLTLNRKDGYVLFSYLIRKKDEEGYLLIPDIQEVFDAIKWGALKSMYFREWNKARNQRDRQHYSQLYQVATQEYEVAFGRANEILNTPRFDEWMDFLEQNWLMMLKEGTENYVYHGIKMEDEYSRQINRLSRK